MQITLNDTQRGLTSLRRKYCFFGRKKWISQVGKNTGLARELLIDNLQKMKCPVKVILYVIVPGSRREGPAPEFQFQSMLPIL